MPDTHVTEAAEPIASAPAHLQPVIERAPKLRAPGSYGPLSRICHWSLLWLGWRIQVAESLPEKCVIVMYPHTSNRDFVIGLLAKWSIGLTVKRDALCFAGKQSLFKAPWGAFFRAVGGFPVNRGSNTGFVDQMADRFARTPRIRFALAPEGTRRYCPHVRSSFYFLSLAAKVPIVLGAFDFEKKRIVIDTFLTPSGDIDADLSAIDGYYQALGNRGDNPSFAAPWKFRGRDPEG